MVVQLNTFVSIVTLLLIHSAISTSIVSITNNTTIEFGLHTCKDSNCVSDLNNRIYLSLFINRYKFQCHIYPIKIDNWYTCNINDMYSTTCNGTHLEYNGIHLLVINEGDNGLHFDEVMVTIKNMDTYKNYSVLIDTFSMNNAQYNQLKESEFSEHEVSRGTYKSIPVSMANILIDMEHIVNDTVNVYAVKNQTTLCVEESDDKYIYVNEQRNWFDAEQYCQDHYGTNLATILSEEDMMRVRLLTGPGIEAWIGLNDLGTESFWEFSDGTTCGPQSCSNLPLWVFGEPNNYNATGKIGEDCGHVSHDLNGFNDKICTRPQRFVCNWGVKNQSINYWIIGGIVLAAFIVLCSIITMCGIVQIIRYRKLTEQTRKKYKKVQNKNMELQKQNDVLHGKIETLECEISIYIEQSTTTNNSTKETHLDSTDVLGENIDMQ
eukprot:463076_1